MLIKTFSSSVFGIEATTITIEVNIAQGINFFIVGLPDSTIKESQQRIKSALKNNNFKIPGKEITINLAPADIRKEGSIFDLAISIGILGASEQIKTDLLSNYILLGELSLDGTIQAMKGVLPIAIKAKEDGFKGVILPKKNAKEAALVSDLEVYGVNHLNDVIAFLNGEIQLEQEKDESLNLLEQNLCQQHEDFKDVKGQLAIKRAFEIAACGGHNLILIGPPGAGKSMLAKRLPSILPPMSLKESLETTKIHSVAGRTKNVGLIQTRPFRKPHHTISDVALIGGGSYPQPGEISLAHNGVLFLDELPEYKRQVLEVMRQPLEDRMVNISRAKFSVDYPASITLIAAMNPCPCGYFNHPEKSCSCSSIAVQKYLAKVSGPLLDRIDMHVEVVPVNFDDLSSENIHEENSHTIRERVIQTRLIQADRFKDDQEIHCNTQMNAKLIRKHCKIDDKAMTLLKTAMDKFGLSARAYDRIIKVARTIADMEKSNDIASNHIAEAIQYRSLDKFF